jgi:hypothetical protein
VNVLQSALFWRAQGIATIPIRYRDKRPLVAWNEFRERLPSTRELYGWFHGRPTNVALVCGWQDLVVVDFDDCDIYGAWRAWALATGGIAADVAELSYQVHTARGVHVYMALDEPPGTLKLDRIDVKAAGGYVLAPPSVHPQGVAYAPFELHAPIIRAGKLDEILPDGLCPSNPVAPEPPAITVQRVDAPVTNNPWQAAIEPARVNGDGPNLIDAAHDRLDLLSMLPHPVYRRGNYYWARCPLHEDTDPSLSYDPRKDKVFCWAGCTGGHWYDAIDFYAALSGMTLGDAIQALAA